VKKNEKRTREVERTGPLNCARRVLLYQSFCKTNSLRSVGYNCDLPDTKCVCSVGLGDVSLRRYIKERSLRTLNPL
jgi:hypothetical protein